MAKTQGDWIAEIWEQEVPSGLVNGSNVTYTLSSTPHSDKAVRVYLNGLVEKQGVGYTITTDTITFTTAPVTGQEPFVEYVKK